MLSLQETAILAAIGLPGRPDCAALPKCHLSNLQSLRQQA
jgi:hypothetical protein